MENAQEIARKTGVTRPGKLERFLGKIPVYAQWAAIGGIILGIGYQIHRENKYQARQHVMSIADTNANGEVSGSEWKAVYDELGHDYHWKQGKDLSLSELKEYLSNHSQK